MSMESVFSVLFGAIILKEVLTARELLGCAIMFVAVILAELNPDALFEKVVARGERVYLREITSSDTDDIIRWRNSENVVKNFIYRKPVTRKDHRNWLKTKVRTGQVRQFILCLNDTGKGIGSIYFRDIDNEKHTCEFGIFIGEQDATGKGYGYEGQKLAMDIAFGEMGMKEVELRVLDGNIPAIRNYEKCGFKVVPEHEEFTESKEKVIFMKAVKTS